MTTKTEYPELSQEEVDRLAEEFVRELHESIALSVDPQGHEHRGKGPGGGQFVSQGEGGEGSEESGERPPRSYPPKPKKETKKKEKSSKHPQDIATPTKKSDRKIHPGAKHGSKVKVTKTDAVAAPRNKKGQIVPVETKTILTKQETGRVAEACMTAYLRDVEGIKDMEPLNTNEEDKAIDLFGDEMAPEVKGGMCNVGKSAQHWRITFSMEIGEKELEEYNSLSPEKQKKWRQKTQDNCLTRKIKLLEEINKRTGRDIKPVTLTGIINPDTQTVDIYKIPGYHQRIGWNSQEAKDGYVGSYKYDHPD